MNVYSVSRINSYINGLISEDFLLSDLAVKGEIGTLKYHSSGHVYFSIKDEKSNLNCMMYSNNAVKLDFRLSEGMSVIVYGAVKVYERDGSYRLYAAKIEKEGLGKLYEEFVRLKEKLEESGMFAPEYKLPIPKYVKRLGVVTARTGAAIRDIINVAKRRNPYIEIILYPALVQGEGAPKSIIAGINALEALNVDVMIVGRGGGSYEDLFAFNDEELAETIFNCSVPVISAVGHEIDNTIADLVADLRAPTPSAAAELAVFDLRSVLDAVDSYEETIKRDFNDILRDRIDLLTGYEKHLKLLSPVRVLNENKTRFENKRANLISCMDMILKKKDHELTIYVEKLKGLSPLNKLGKGYAYISHDNVSVNSVSEVSKGDDIKLTLPDGYINAKVTGTETEKIYG